MISLRLFPFVFLLLISLSGCVTTSPYAQDFNIVSIQDEIALGNQMNVELRKQKRIVTDPKANHQVQSIGKRLLSHLPRTDYNYRFFIISDKEPNAFAVPGGTIYVHSGLLSFVDNQDQLAGVLAHEIAHLYERHTAKNMTRVYGAQLLANLLIKDNTGLIQKLAVQMATGGVLASFSRHDETEADEVGYWLARRAGFRDRGLIEFLYKLQQKSKSGVQVSFLRRHPATPERIANLKKLSQTNTNRLYFYQ